MYSKQLLTEWKKLKIERILSGKLWHRLKLKLEYEIPLFFSLEKYVDKILNADNFRLSLCYSQ